MAETAREELPLADYDHLPVPALRDRIRSLTADEVRQVLDYERAHADRAPVVTTLENRLEQLEQGAEPSPGGDQETRPDQPGPTRHGSPVSPDSAAEPIHPPPKGVAGQPGKPKGNRQVGD
ncbi:hypothetical protein B0I33_108103 [Prauserella shujinwangii]|uniref:DUF8129 domain-containing protein n=1 Tax=Prauserella shujinwangii TaxID=1453103 RepID=A0A2T0LR26_9PSEU|nr:hypothetical protein [Prauserella shujinwangii]PRX45956.1 hypothetical protein B0I33_108103 [Prauserella shujinwangii]